VQAGLKERGIEIPEDTHFLAALHDTTTDEIILYDADHPAPAHAEDIKQAKAWFRQAGSLTRGERALRLPRAGGDRRHRAALPRLGGDAAGMGAGGLQGLHRRAARADHRQKPSGPRLPA
jgi:hypothetical protein